MWPCMMFANLSNDSFSLSLVSFFCIQFFETVNSYFNSKNLTSFYSSKTKNEVIQSNLSTTAKHGDKRVGLCREFDLISEFFR